MKDGGASDMPPIRLELPEHARHGRKLDERQRDKLRRGFAGKLSGVLEMLQRSSTAPTGRARKVAPPLTTIVCRTASSTGNTKDPAGLTKWLPEATFYRMRAVGLKVLKNRLSEYVRLAASGETVLVTDRDRVVAELVPPRENRSPWLADALLADVVREGWISAPIMAGGGPPPRLPVAPLAQILSELDRDRSDQ